MRWRAPSIGGLAVNLVFFGPSCHDRHPTMWGVSFGPHVGNERANKPFPESSYGTPLLLASSYVCG